MKQVILTIRGTIMTPIESIDHQTVGMWAFIILILIVIIGNYKHKLETKMKAIQEKKDADFRANVKAIKENITKS